MFQFTRKSLFLSIFLFALFNGHTFGASESPQSFTFQGRLFNSAGTNTLEEPVVLLFQIYDPSGSCILYQETQNVDLTNTSGNFSVSIGSAVGAAKRTPGTDPGFSMERVFKNDPLTQTRAVDATTCPSGYNPTAGDTRLLRVQVTPSSTGIPEVLSPDQTINSVPHAIVAETLQGLGPSDFIKKDAAYITNANVDKLFGSLVGGVVDASSLHHHDGRYVVSGSSTAQDFGSGGFNTSGKGSIGSSVNFTDTTLAVKPYNDVNVGMAIRAYSGSQTADLFQVQNSLGEVLTKITANGNMDVASTAGSQLVVKYDATNKATVDVSSTGRTTITASGTNPEISLLGGNVGIGTAAPESKLDISTILSASSGTEYGLKIRPYISQTSSAGFTGFLMNILKTTTGSGEKMLLDLRVNDIRKFSVDESGAIAANTIVAKGLFNDGTATSPSISFANDPMTGIYKDGNAGTLNFSLGGTTRGFWNWATFNITATSSARMPPSLIQTSLRVGDINTNATHTLDVVGRTVQTNAIHNITRLAAVGNSGFSPGAGYGGRLNFSTATYSGAFVPSDSASIQWGWEGAQTNDTTDRDGYLSFFSAADGIVNERMRITSTGNIGIGTSIPSEKLHILGNLRVQGSTDCTLGDGSGGTNCSSDIRLKTNVEEIEDSLKKILSLRGVEFDWNEKSQSPGRHDIGVIAQDVEKVFPTAVIHDDKTSFKKVDYAVLVAPLIESIKELHKYFIELLKLSQDHSDEIASLNAKISKLEAENTRLKVIAIKAEQENSEFKSRLNRLEKTIYTQSK